MMTNILTPFPTPKDPTAVDRKRRSRARQKLRKERVPPGARPSTTPVTLVTEAASTAATVWPVTSQDRDHRNFLQSIEVSPETAAHADRDAGYDGRSIAIRNAALAASSAAAEGGHGAWLLRYTKPLDAHVPHPGQDPVMEAPAAVPTAPAVLRVGLDDRGLAPSSIQATSWWSAIGRAVVGLAIIGTGGFIAYTSMRANAWFGHNLTPDPVAGEVYSHLSVAAEVIACLLPTAIRFYWQDGNWWTALWGWTLLAVCLLVVFFAAGGFAVSNLAAGTEARAERQTAETVLAQRKLATIANSRQAECIKRGPRCRDLEHQEQDAIAELEHIRDGVKQDADPQAAALGLSSARLRVVQAGALVALCLFSGLFISFGAGLIWRRPAPCPPEAR